LRIIEHAKALLKVFRNESPVFRKLLLKNSAIAQKLGI
jgi:hypothetical protein